MLRQVEVGAAVYALHLLEAKWHEKLDVGGGVGIVCQLLVVVEAILVVAQAQGLVPLQAGLLPELKPLHLLAGTHKELHLHLLKLAHAEDELASHYLVAEGLAYLRDTEGDAHAAGLLHIQEVHKDALGGLGA